MNEKQPPSGAHIPSRFERPGILQLLVLIVGVYIVVRSFQGAEFSVSRLLNGLPDMGEMIGEMFPPSLDRIDKVLASLFETLEMVVCGALVGIVLAFPLAALASRATSPHPIIRHITRALVSLVRTIPDLVWALFFVATVGLGPFAGTLTLALDTLGFCGRFFAEAMEEVPKEPQEALLALGAGRIARFFVCIVPAALPSFINSALYSVEKAVRSSVVLGLVGAGGIGIELKVSMDMFRYAEASTIILCILVLVILVEQLSSALRKKVM